MTNAENFVWSLEYYHPYPHATLRFEVIASTLEEATQQGDSLVQNLRRTATIKERPLGYCGDRTTGQAIAKIDAGREG